MKSRALWTALATALFLGLVAVLVRLAWLSDDAYITLRTIENWLAGRGLCWNAGERVQTYTHPLWLLLLALARALTGEHANTTLAVGIGCALLATLLLLRQCHARAAAAAVAALLLASRSFGDYATSGLENPLAFVLLAALVATFAGFGGQAPARRLLRLALLAGLLATTRLDLALLAAPALLAAVRGVALPRAALAVAAGLLPLWLWLLFAVGYYGTPWPITAYAKAWNGVPARELLAQGGHYLRYVAVHDGALVAVLGLGIGLGFVRPALRCRALALGALLYCGYVVGVGGDFMAGRMLTPPFVVAIAILGRFLAARSERWSLLAVAAAAVLTFAAGTPPWLSSPGDEVAAIDRQRREAGDDLLDHGILDERANYFASNGLLSPQRSVPVAGVFSAAMRATGRTQPMVMIWGQVGRFGFEAGDLVHLVDPWLCDPLLMRLPIGPGPWRIGHFKRRLPAGYLETLACGQDRLHDPGIRRYYEVLRPVLRAPLLDEARLAALGRLLRGAAAADLATFVDGDYRAPPRLPAPLADLEPPVPVGTPWFDAAHARVVGDGGLAVQLPGPVAAHALRARLQPNVRYRFRLRRGGAEIGSVEIDACDAQRFLGAQDTIARYAAIVRHAPDFFASINGTTLLLACCLGLQELEVAIPPEIGAFDSVWIDTVNLSEFGVAAIGGLQFGG